MPLSGLLSRILANAIVMVTLVFLFNNYLIFWLDWPGALTFLAHKGWLGVAPLDAQLEGGKVTLGWLQFLSYAVDRGVTVFYVSNRRAHLEDATRDNLTALGYHVLISNYLRYFRVVSFFRRYTNRKLGIVVGMKR